MESVRAHPEEGNDADIVITSEVSSAAGDPNLWVDLRHKVMKIVENYEPIDSSDDTITVLSVFAENLPKRGQVVLWSEITRYGKDHAKMRQLRNNLVDAILIPMRKSSGLSSDVISQPVDESAPDEIRQSIVDIGSQDRASDFRGDCLKRDNNKCVVTGRTEIDLPQFKLMPRLPRLLLGPTECAHIIPFKLRKFRCDSLEVSNRTTVWWTIHRYFPDLACITAESINQVENGFTIFDTLHKHFDNFLLAFEPKTGCGQANRYNVRWFAGLSSMSLGIDIPDEIHLTSVDPQIPLPNPAFFDAHHRVARILDVSGIGGKIWGIERDIEEDPENLASDGSTNVASVIYRRMLTNL